MSEEQAGYHCKRDDVPIPAAEFNRSMYGGWPEPPDGSLPPEPRMVLRSERDKTQCPYCVVEARFERRKDMFFHLMDRHATDAVEEKLRSVGWTLDD